MNPLITLLFGIATLLFRIATATYIVASWHFKAAENLYLADIDRRMKRRK